jgi:hypothetical protein
VAPVSTRPNGFQTIGDRTAPTTFVPESIRMVKPVFAVAKHFLKKIAGGVLTTLYRFKWCGS